MQYQWKSGARKSGMDAQKVGERLEKIRLKDGVIRPEAVLKEAKRKSSPLHNGFEWDDNQAAKLYRLDRARDITRSILVTVKGTKEEPVIVRAFVHIGEVFEYEDIHTVLRTPDKRDSLLALALADLEQIRARFSTLEELAGVWAAMDEVTP